VFSLGLQCHGLSLESSALGLVTLGVCVDISNSVLSSDATHIRRI